MNNKLLIKLVIFAVLGLGIGYFIGYDIGYEKALKKSINSFEDCAAAGYPIMESYPERCAANGKTFTKQY